MAHALRRVLRRVVNVTYAQPESAYSRKDDSLNGGLNALKIYSYCPLSHSPLARICGPSRTYFVITA